LASCNGDRIIERPLRDVYLGNRPCPCAAGVYPAGWTL